MALKIVEIIRDVKGLAIPIIFRVGVAVVEGGQPISEILYCRDGYSSGSKGRRPAYAVKFLDSPEVRIIPEDAIIDIAVVSEETPKDKKTAAKTDMEAIPLPD